MDSPVPHLRGGLTYVALLTYALVDGPNKLCAGWKRILGKQHYRCGAGVDCSVAPMRKHHSRFVWSMIFVIMVGLSVHTSYGQKPNRRNVQDITSPASSN